MKRLQSVRTAKMLFVAAMLALAAGASSQDRTKNEKLPGEQTPVKTAPIKCPEQFVCKMPSRGVDYPVCHDGAMPPTCDKQSDCVKLGLGKRSCTKVAPFFSLCIQACVP